MKKKYTSPEVEILNEMESSDIIMVSGYSEVDLSDLMGSTYR